MRKFKEMKENNKGFSLVELIIVIAIMAVLVGVLAPQFIKYVESSKQSTDIQNAAEIRAAVEAYVAESAPSDNITVSISADGKTIVVAGGSVGTALSEVGLNASTALKSTGWQASGAAAAKHVATYNVATFKWAAADGTSNVPDCKNTKKPEKDLADAFR